MTWPEEESHVTVAKHQQLLFGSFTHECSKKSFGVMLGEPALLYVHSTFFVNSKIILWLICMVCMDKLDP